MKEYMRYNSTLCRPLDALVERVDAVEVVVVFFVRAEDYDIVEVAAVEERDRTSQTSARSRM